MHKNVLLACEIAVSVTLKSKQIILEVANLYAQYNLFVSVLLYCFY